MNGTTDRRQFLTGVAALAAGAVISGAREAGAQSASATPRLPV
jgi:hypothetical protein